MPKTGRFSGVLPQCLRNAFLDFRSRIFYNTFRNVGGGLVVKGRLFVRQNRKQSSRVLFRFTISYLLLMLIPLLIGITAYSIALRNAEDQLIRTNELALERASSEIESSIKEAETFVSSLSMNDELAQVFSSEEHRPSSLQQIISGLPEFTDTYRLVQRYFIYVPDTQLIVDNRNAYLQLRKYYATTFHYGDMSQDEFEEQVLEGRSYSALLPVTENEYMQRKYRSMLYVQRLVLPSRKSGKVVFYIDEEALLKRLQIHFDPGIAFTGMCRSDGTALLYTDEENRSRIFGKLPADTATGSFRLPEVGLVSFHRSDVLGAELVVAVPQEYVSDQLKAVRTTTFTGLFLMLTVGVLLALGLFFHNRKPLAAAIETLPSPQEENGHRGLYWLEYAVRDLTESHEQLEAAIRLQRVELQNAAVHRLISGGEKTESGIEKLLDYVGIHLNGDWFRAVLVRTGGSEEWDDAMTPNGDIRRANLRQTLTTLEPDLVFLGLQSQNVCALIRMGQEEQEDDQAVYHRLYQKLLEAGESGSVISVGQKKHSLVALYLSFTEAEQLMERAEDGSWLLIGQHGSDSGYHFTMHDEQRLGNLAASSDLEEINQLIDHLWQENFVRRNVTGFEREMLYYRMMDTAIQASGNPELMGEERHIVTHMNPDEFFTLMRGKFRQVCEELQEKRRQSSNTLLDQIIAYIRESYSDCSMCLASAAMRFGFTEKYLSAFFKEKAGVNFSVYLEDLRMEKATELLNTTRLTIEEISRMVGYNSAKSFSRAFYRRMGHTPSQHRNPG